MAEESQNALLKTLEEPPGYAHLILITSEPGALLETVRSRLAEVRFAALPLESVERRLAAELPSAAPEELRALAALAGGRSRSGARPRLPLGPAAARPRRGLRARSLPAASSPRAPGPTCSRSPPSGARSEGARVAEAAGERADELGKGRDADRIRREGAEGAKRAERRARTEAVDLALGLVATWFTDVVAVAEGAPELARNADRAEQLAADARDADPVAAGSRRSSRCRPGAASRSTSTRSWRWTLCSTAPLKCLGTSLQCSKTDAAMSAEVPGPPMTKPPELPELPVTADRPAIQPTLARRVFGVRLWLALMFAGIGILTGTTVYLVVSGSSESAAEQPLRRPRVRAHRPALRAGRGAAFPTPR